MSFLLQETGDKILQETGDGILLDELIVHPDVDVFDAITVSENISIAINEDRNINEDSFDKGIHIY